MASFISLKYASGYSRRDFASDMERLNLDIIVPSKASNGVTLSDHVRNSICVENGEEPLRWYCSFLNSVSIVEVIGMKHNVQIEGQPASGLSLSNARLDEAATRRNLVRNGLLKNWGLRAACMCSTIMGAAPAMKLLPLTFRVKMGLLPVGDFNWAFVFPGLEVRIFSAPDRRGIAPSELMAAARMESSDISN